MLNKERPEVIDALINCFTNREDVYAYKHVALEKFRDGMNIEQEFKKPLATQIQEWLYTEYVEPFKLNRMQKNILESFDPTFWIARDSSGDLELFMTKPEVSNRTNYWTEEGAYTIDVYNDLFLFIDEMSCYRVGDILENCEVVG